MGTYGRTLSAIFNAEKKFKLQQLQEYSILGLQTQLPVRCHRLARFRLFELWSLRSLEIKQQKDDMRWTYKWTSIEQVNSLDLLDSFINILIPIQMIHISKSIFLPLEASRGREAWHEQLWCRGEETGNVIIKSNITHMTNCIKLRLEFASSSNNQLLSRII